MNEGNSQKNFEVQLESTRNSADHSPTHLTPTIQLKPRSAISSERTAGKSSFRDTNLDLNTQVCGNVPYHLFFKCVGMFTRIGSAKPGKAAPASTERANARSASSASDLHVSHPDLEQQTSCTDPALGKIFDLIPDSKMLKNINHPEKKTINQISQTTFLILQVVLWV